MTNKQLAAVIVAILALAAMACATVIMVWGGDTAEAKLYELGGIAGGWLISSGFAAYVMRDTDHDGVPDVLDAEPNDPEVQ